jgi:hypothetical protein
MVFYKWNTPPPQRRPLGHAGARRSTKRGCTKRGLRTRLLSLVDEESGSDDEGEEDDGELSSSVPPVPAVVPHMSASIKVTYTVGMGQARGLLLVTRYPESGISRHFGCEKFIDASAVVPLSS